MNVNEQANCNLTPLHLAAFSGQTEIVELLLNDGADPSILTSVGERTEDLARQEGHHELAELLRSAIVNIRLT